MNVEMTIIDEDLEMPLEGAVVSLRDGRQFICDTQGMANFTLPDGQQSIIQVSYPGYETRRLTVMATRKDTPERMTVALRLGGIMEGRELVVEAQRPESSETRVGRSVAISERELTRTAEIGIIEDVMSSVKLLPGVGYTGMFGATPSIRGGDPGDLMASLDGFYLERPYYWMGAISIFDPKMVSSARLSHGVFSARYGHTVSGLLEVTSKSPSPTETELEVSLGSSAATLNLSYPLNGKGGLLFMGRVTYWDTLIWTLQGLSTVVEDETLAMINAITTSPFIRSLALAANYRFTQNLEWRLNGFFGSDGIGADYETDYDDDEIKGTMDLAADYKNYQGFLITGLSASPIPTLALRFTGGVGFIRTITDDYVDNNITARYNDEFLALFPLSMADELRGQTYTAPNINAGAKLDNTIFNAQVRADADWDLGHGFITAFGVQELYSLWAAKTDVSLSFIEFSIDDIRKQNEMIVLMMEESGLFPIVNIPNAALVRPEFFSSDVLNHGFTTSAYALLEYSSPNQRFGAELGLRLDHFYFLGKGFSIPAVPALNPRLNIDFNILKNRGNLDSITATIGTGLFSSINPLLSFFDPDRFKIGESANFDDIEMKLNRAWTSVIGLKIDMAQEYSFNIEGYYKRIFDRGYITADLNSGITPKFNFDGVGNVWGFDLQLQKLESRYWDGWISYSFNWAKYMDPSGGGSGVNMSSIESIGEQWYYPSFHRFHNCNVVLNFKPLRWFNIGLRFGFASGQPRDRVDDTIYPYPVQVVDENYMPQLDENGKPVIIQKYGRKSWYDENERSAWSLPLDLKFSFFLFDKKGRVSTEIYLAGENLASLFYKPEGNTTFNDYTGKEDVGGGLTGFDLPIPMISFGFKWRY